MSEGDSLLAYCVEYPDEDAPRLVYADWLEDNADPHRAEFIRTQVELASPQTSGGAARRKVLKKREKALFAEHGKRWAGALGNWCSAYLPYWSRGFPHVADFRGYLCAVGDALPELFAAAPITELVVEVERVSAGDGEEMAASADLSRLRCLRLWSEVTNVDPPGPTGCEAEVAALLRSRHLTNLARFEARSVWVDESAVRALTELPSLRELELSDCGLGADVVGQIGRSPLAARLTVLDLSGGHGEANLRAVAGHPSLCNLRTLLLEHQGGDEVAARRLADSAHLAGLRELSLYGSRIWDAGAAALSGSPHFSKLQKLNLMTCGIGEAGARSLLDSPTLPRGLRLDLSNNRLPEFTPELRAALRRRFRKVVFE